MKGLLSTILIAGCFAQANAQILGYEHLAETEHLRLAWNEGAISDEGIEVLKSDGEKYYAAIRAMLGEAPDGKVVILIEGPAEQPDGSWKTPRVDGYGRVHLYKYGPTYHDYMGAYAHELVHAMRIGRNPHHDWFFEEGLAEFIALRIDNDLRGFPWYGYPVDIVAGQWMASEEDIPLSLLREKHREINMPCKAQSYSLRSAFFDYLGRTYGDEAGLEMAKQPEAGSLDDYTEFIGKDLETLAAEWREALLASYRETDDAEVQAARYRTESPVQYMPVCTPDGQIQD